MTEISNKRKEDKRDEKREEEEEEEQDEENGEPFQKKQRKHPRKFVDQHNITKKQITYENSAASHDFAGKGLRWLPEDNDGVTAAQVSKSNGLFVTLRCQANHKHEIVISSICRLKKCPQCPKRCDITLESFLATTKRVRKEGGMDDDCFEFENPTKQLRYNGKTFKIQNLALVLKNGYENYENARKIERKIHIFQICDNQLCCNPDHLCQITHIEFLSDKPRDNKGEKHPNSKLTDVQRQEIYNRNNQGEKIKNLAAEFKLNVTTIQTVIKLAKLNPEEAQIYRKKRNTRQKYKKCTINQGENNPNSKLKDTQRNEIINLKKQGEKSKFLASKFGVSVRCINNVLNRGGVPEESLTP